MPQTSYYRCQETVRMAKKLYPSLYIYSIKALKGVMYKTLSLACSATPCVPPFSTLDSGEFQILHSWRQRERERESLQSLADSKTAAPWRLVQLQTAHTKIFRGQQTSAEREKCTHSFRKRHTFPLQLHFSSSAYPSSLSPSWSPTSFKWLKWAFKAAKNCRHMGYLLVGSVRTSPSSLAAIQRQ